MGRTAQQIKEAIFLKAVQKAEPAGKAEILGEEGFLFKLSSREFQKWRRINNSEDESIAELGPAKLVQLSFRDEAGSLIYEDLDVAFLANLPEPEVFPLYQRCLQINGYGIEGAETLLKNLLKTLGDAGVYGLLASIGAPCPNCTKGTAPANSASSGSPSGSGPSALPPKASSAS